MSEFKKNLLDGRGDFYYNDGSKYSGQRKKGKMHGEVVINNDKGEIYRGFIYQGTLCSEEEFMKKITSKFSHAKDPYKVVYIKIHIYNSQTLY